MKKIKNKTDCSFIHSNLFLYQEKLLSGMKLTAFEDHLKICTECSRMVSEFKSVTTLMEGKKLVEINPFIRTRIIQGLESHLERPGGNQIPVLQKILRPVSMSILMLIAVIIGFSIVRTGNTMFPDNANHLRDIQAMKSGLNIPDFIDEEKTVFINQ
jgi:hypothetical protein